MNSRTRSWVRDDTRGWSAGVCWSNIRKISENHRKIIRKKDRKIPKKYSPLHLNQMSQIIENTRQEQKNNKQDKRIAHNKIKISVKQVNKTNIVYSSCH